MARVAAEQASTILRQALQERGKARLIAATGAAQFEFLEVLTNLPGIDWSQVEIFHLDEYIGLPPSHTVSFCRFLQERLIQKKGITRHLLLNEVHDQHEVIRRVGQEWINAPTVVYFVYMD